ncbi:MAG TPA: hypothetical protein DIT34_10635 [Acinetobacter ursingii]|uniref:Uncharacterized protein n=1 Tax=Acinetobacter ursingii TaxID=108980 RepID=A0A3D2SN27_9GAMM|nr:hypothetical protein [Salmonella enterica subsp. enterica serovar Paratyphi A]PPZ94662.1 hypothetical protein C5B41_08150 [Acinetobacter ursingii]PZT88051.1 MAG: hypothetical protein DI627_05145 [Acinetobacter sp.]RSO82213.1 hypothetical protein EA748_10510 [Acinetobacter ursingii]HCK30202.1 hypothetical protein [Acinetobacter ursingii]
MSVPQANFLKCKHRDKRCFPQSVFLLNFWILSKLLENATHYLFNKYPYFELMIHVLFRPIYNLSVLP